MSWIGGRLKEPSTWSAFAALFLAAGFSLMTDVSWWRDCEYAAAACALVSAALSEKSGR
jgi:hypothetical protein